MVVRIEADSDPTEGNEPRHSVIGARAVYSALGAPSASLKNIPQLYDGPPGADPEDALLRPRFGEAARTAVFALCFIRSPPPEAAYGAPSAVD
jgi:hypothetical protein